MARTTFPVEVLLAFEDGSGGLASLEEPAVEEPSHHSESSRDVLKLAGGHIEFCQARPGAETGQQGAAAVGGEGRIRLNQEDMYGKLR